MLSEQEIEKKKKFDALKKKLTDKNALNENLPNVKEEVTDQEA